MGERMTISIQYDSDSGEVTNRYFGERPGAAWTQTDASDWPDPEPGSDEYAVYFYDDQTGSITAEIRTTANA